MNWQITARTGKRRGESWLITKHPLTIGRSLSCHIAVNDPTVSRRHCELLLDESGVRLRDLGSRNVTLVNGNAVNECLLRVGDELFIGTACFIVGRNSHIQGVQKAETITDTTTISVNRNDLFPREGRAPHGPKTQKMVTLYSLSRALQHVDAEHQFASTCLATLEKFFPPPVKAYFYIRGEGKGHTCYPTNLPLPAHSAKHVESALRLGRNTLDVERKFPFRASTQTAIAPLCTRTGARAALILVTDDATPHLGDAEIECLTNIAEIAALHWTVLIAADQAQASETDFDADEPLTFLGKSAEATRLRKEIRLAAKSRFPTLITGEAGTGKKLAARLIHEQSAPPVGPLISANCAAITGPTFSRSILGEERETAEGGHVIDTGLLDQANGGTLILQDIDVLSEKDQALLSRILSRHLFARLNSPGEVAFCGRVIATSQVDLETTVFRGTFRNDLFQLIGRQHIHIAPLRNRRSDIRTLARNFLRREKKKSPHSYGKLNEEALGYLEELPLGQNATELKQAIHQAARPDSTRQGMSDVVSNTGHTKDPESLEPLEHAECALIAAIVRQCGGDKDRAAEILGMPRLEVERIANSNDAPRNF